MWYGPDAKCCYSGMFWPLHTEAVLHSLDDLTLIVW